MLAVRRCPLGLKRVVALMVAGRAGIVVAIAIAIAVAARRRGGLVGPGVGDAFFGLAGRLGFAQSAAAPVAPRRSPRGFDRRCALGPQIQWRGRGLFRRGRRRGQRDLRQRRAGGTGPRLVTLRRRRGKGLADLGIGQGWGRLQQRRAGGRTDQPSRPSQERIGEQAGGLTRVEQRRRHGTARRDTIGPESHRPLPVPKGGGLAAKLGRPV